MAGPFQRLRHIELNKMIGRCLRAVAGAKGWTTDRDHPKKSLLPIWEEQLQGYGRVLSETGQLPAASQNALKEIDAELHEIFLENPYNQQSYEESNLPLAWRVRVGWRWKLRIARYVLFGSEF